jgi:hypothetical protein
VKLNEKNISSAGSEGVPLKISMFRISGAPVIRSRSHVSIARASRYIPVATKNAVLKRSGGKCEYRSEIAQGAAIQPGTTIQPSIQQGASIQHNSTAPVKVALKKRCGSQHSLEFHHTHPFAMGGTASAGNIQLFCAAHNRAQGKWDFSSHY